jgi:hypothetical protein
MREILSGGEETSPLESLEGGSCKGGDVREIFFAQRVEAEQSVFGTHVAVGIKFEGSQARGVALEMLAQ